SRVDLLGNRLVLIAPKDNKTELVIRPGFDLAGALGGGRLAMADPAAVPAGLYGKAALEALGAWPSVANHIAAAENVRAALLLVAAGQPADRRGCRAVPRARAFLGQVAAQCRGPSAVDHAAGRHRLCAAAAVRQEGTDRRVPRRSVRHRLRLPLDRRGVGLRGH